MEPGNKDKTYARKPLIDWFATVMYIIFSMVEEDAYMYFISCMLQDL